MLFAITFDKFALNYTQDYSITISCKRIYEVLPEKWAPVMLCFQVSVFCVTVLKYPANFHSSDVDVSMLE